MDNGLIFCHGHAHNPIPDFFLDSEIHWTYVDNNPSADPDVIYDIKNENIVQYFGPNSQKTIVLISCPIARDFDDFMIILSRLKELILLNGFIYITNGLFFILSYIDILYKHMSMYTSVVDINSKYINLYLTIITKYNLSSEYKPENSRERREYIKNLYLKNNKYAHKLVNSFLDGIINKIGFTDYGVVEVPQQLVVGGRETLQVLYFKK